MISPVGIVIAIVVLGAWVGLVFVKELIKFKREERRDRKTEARADAKRQKDMEIQELIQDYGDALNQRREREEQQRQLQEVVDRASANAPANAATQRPAPRITPPIGRIASPSQSANKRRLASLTGSAIALPYFVPRKPFEADVGAVRAWESPYATTKLNNR